ncbi:hypothetical protein Zmor_004082 [Zophobas morio]|uniref:Uncharacterized protein n=1 Tax=Zophobas morio TaxID=2755281 RepID=A0AA38HLE3_9CUCU|nr:hypothetical protein Zmor_004082 [Zophobas morio]
MIRALQLNCGRAESVMNELGVVAREKGVNACLLQEPLVRNERAAGMNVFNSEWAAVVVDSKEMDIMCVEECTNEWGVCVRLDSKNGPMYVGSILSQLATSYETDLPSKSKFG